MRELSIEEKAQRYDEALKVAKGLYAKGAPDSLHLERMFPVLKESDGEDEDERIRMFLHHTFTVQYLCKDKLGKWHGEPVVNILAWLEKQGEYQEYPKDIIDNAISFLANRNDGMSEKEAKDIVNAIITVLNPSYWPKQGEQKPVDKVEPKFKIEKGKWYVCIRDLLDDYAEKAFCKGDIYLSTQDGSLIPSNSNVPYKVVCSDTYFRDWTIQDAKDGDVLCTYECGKPKIVFILKGMPKKHYALSYHCYYNIMYPNFGSDSEKGCLAPNDEDIKPATKEQRDTLKKAMADAGYIFDFEKKELKELKKVEQEPTEDTNLQEFESYLCLMFQKFRTKGMCTNGEIIDYVKEYSQKLRDILVKSAWSKKDEEMWLSTIEYVQTYPAHINSVVDWLKSLKERYTWKPSDAQMVVLNDIIINGHLSNANERILKGLQEQLKKLKG